MRTIVSILILILYSILHTFGEEEISDADISDDKFMTEQILDIASEVQEYINKSYMYFAKKFLNIGEDHRFDIKQEVIASQLFGLPRKDMVSGLSMMVV